jgi:uncharacterized protein YkwD
MTFQGDIWEYQGISICSLIFHKSVMQYSPSKRSTRTVMRLAMGAIVALNLVVLVSPATAVDTPPMTLAKAPTDSTSRLEQAAHNQINRYRASKELPPLKWSSAIAAPARQHSAAMASGQTSFGHGGFQARVKATGVVFQGAAENVAYNQGYRDPVDAAIQGWLKSPGHRKNIEGNYDTAGIGVARNANGEIYFTQVFIRSRQAEAN